MTTTGATFSHDMISKAHRVTPVAAYVTFIATLALAATITGWVVDPVRGTASAPGLADLGVFLALGVGLQISEIRLAVGGASGSIAFIIYVAAALIFGPTWCVVITASTVAAGQLLNRRSSVKIVFNVSQHVLALLAGLLIYAELGGTLPARSLDKVLLPFLGFASTYFVLNSGAVSGIVALSEGRSLFEVWRRNTWGLIGYDLMASAFGLGIAWVYLRSGVISIAGLVVPILFLRHAYAVNLQLQAQNQELLELMVKAIEARDPYTSGHSLRVSMYAKALAKEIGLSTRHVDGVETAALLHDVGKIHEEYAPILRKQGKLTQEEFELMKTHAVRSHELVKTISRFRGDVEFAVRHHHEDYDGRGYPDAIEGDHIPLGARIIRIADTTDAMTTDRPYRKALSYERVISELEKFSGTQFDPALVAAFRRSSALKALLHASRRPEAITSPAASPAARPAGASPIQGAFARRVTAQ